MSNSLLPASPATLADQASLPIATVQTYLDNALYCLVRGSADRGWRYATTTAADNANAFRLLMYRLKRGENDPRAPIGDGSEYRLIPLKDVDEVEKIPGYTRHPLTTVSATNIDVELIVQGIKSRDYEQTSEAVERLRGRMGTSGRMPELEPHVLLLLCDAASRFIKPGGPA